MIRFSAVFIAGALFATTAQAEIKCVAVHEWMNARNKLEQIEKELVKSFEAPDMLVLETDLDGRNFSLRGDPKGDEFLIFITQAPNYDKGIVLNAGFNGAGQLRVSSVDGTVVHKLVCSR